MKAQKGTAIRYRGAQIGRAPGGWFIRDGGEVVSHDMPSQAAAKRLVDMARRFEAANRRTWR